MSGGDQDRRIQDYLDGRLDPEERREFEERLRDDPELAERVRVLREAGDLLREDPGDLSPGFYTRARARFEESMAPRRPAWRHLLSWEAIGVATAALVVAAILFPMFREGEVDLVAPTVKEVRESAPTPFADEADDVAAGEAAGEAAVNEVPEEEDEAQPSPEALRYLADAGEAPAPEETKVEAEPPDREEPFAPVPDAFVAREKQAATAAPPPPKKGRSRQVAAVPVDHDAEAADNLPPSKEELLKQIRQAARELEERYGEESAVASEPEAGYAVTGRSDREAADVRGAREAPDSLLIVVGDTWAGGFTPVPVKWAALPFGVVPPRTTELVRSEAVWASLIVRQESDALSELEVDFETERVALIGQTDPPFDCARTLVIALDLEAIITLPDAGPDAPRIQGCAVVVPATTEQLRIDRSDW